MDFIMSSVVELLKTDVFIWIGIVFCLSQSAMFSGLNLAFFSVSRLKLEVDAHQNDAVDSVLKLRKDSNFLLTTLLWGNVSINVLLTLLSNSVMVGAAAFIFSTVVITICGEIAPQAYFSRHAIKMASIMVPIIKFYQLALYPVAKPCALMLDGWLGKEGIDYMGEEDLKAIIYKHIEAEEADVEKLEGIGALNFLSIDDLRANQEGEVLDQLSILELPVKMDLPIIPDVSPSADDPFLQRVQASGHSWVVLVNSEQEPLMVLDADGYLRTVMFAGDQDVDPYRFCHRPIIIRDETEPLGNVVQLLKSSDSNDYDHDGVIENDVVLLWSSEKRIITGADILGRLLKGVAAGEISSSSLVNGVEKVS